MKSKSRLIALSAVILALTIVLGALPYVFLLPLLFMCVHGNLKTVLIAALFFGLVSLGYAFMGASLVSLAFMKMPWIPIVPRIFTGLLARGAFVAMDKLIKKEGKLKKYLPVAAAATVGSLSNTVLITLSLLLFLPDVAMEGITLYAYIPTILISGAIELAVNNAVLPPLCLAYEKATKRLRRA